MLRACASDKLVHNFHYLALVTFEKKASLIDMKHLLHHFQQHIYVSLRLRVQNAVSSQPCVGKLGISLVLLNFLDCNFRLWFETP